jgi:hypothetical protein
MTVGETQNNITRSGKMELKEILNEALRQWNEFADDRKDCTLEDYNNFILEIAEQVNDRTE